MYQFPYADILSDDMSEARRNERAAFDEAVHRLQAARMRGPDSREAIEALYYLDRFWKVLLEDLANPSNGLPDELKASLISIGIWVLKETEALRNGRAHSFDGLIEINEIIRDGLRTAA